MFELRNWSLMVSVGDPFMPPEAFPKRLSGEVFGNPRFDDGSIVTTSRIESITGRKVITRSGSIYMLDGLPHQDYLIFLADNGFEYNDEHPLEIKNAPETP